MLTHLRSEGIVYIIHLHLSCSCFFRVFFAHSYMISSIPNTNNFNSISTHLRGEGIVYIIHLHLLCSCFFRVFLHTVIWYQVFLSNTNNLETDLFDP